MKTFNPKPGPVEYVNYKSISIPIYRDDTIKKGKTYTGFRFFYQDKGEVTRTVRAKTLEKIRRAALEVAQDMLKGTFSATSGAVVLTGPKLTDYQTLMDFEKEVGDVLVFITDAVRAWRILAKVPRASLLAAASHYASSVSSLRPMSVKWAALRYLARNRHRWSGSYFRRAKRHIGYFIALHGSKQIRDITMTDLETFMTTYKRRVAGAKTASKASKTI